MKIYHIRRVCAVLFLAAFFSACSTNKVALYSWRGYESQVYARMRGGSSPDAQLGILEKDLEVIKSGVKPVPPGFYAHLGLLYLETGNQVMAIACFREEKTRFPEAVIFMDFLLKNYGEENAH